MNEIKLYFSRFKNSRKNSNKPIVVKRKSLSLLASKLEGYCARSVSINIVLNSLSDCDSAMNLIKCAKASLMKPGQTIEKKLSLELIPLAKSIVTRVEGGKPPYTYQWNTWQTTRTIRINNGGMYICRVTDANGNTTENHTSYWNKIAKIITPKNDKNKLHL